MDILTLYLSLFFVSAACDSLAIFVFVLLNAPPPGGCTPSWWHWACHWPATGECVLSLPPIESAEAVLHCAWFLCDRSSLILRAISLSLFCAWNLCRWLLLDCCALCRLLFLDLLSLSPSISVDTLLIPEGGAIVGNGQCFSPLVLVLNFSGVPFCRTVSNEMEMTEGLFIFLSVCFCVSCNGHHFYNFYAVDCLL